MTVFAKSVLLISSKNGPTFTTNQCEKCPFSIRPLEHDSSHITTRPGLPSTFRYSYKSKNYVMLEFLFIASAMVKMTIYFVIFGLKPNFRVKLMFASCRLPDWRSDWWLLCPLGRLEWWHSRSQKLLFQICHKHNTGCPREMNKEVFTTTREGCNEINFLKLAIPSLTDPSFTKDLCKNVSPVFGAGIQTKDILNMGLLP